ncbi:MAG: 50S ribosomal protein L16 [Nanoarchaeota archaeon]
MAIRKALSYSKKINRPYTRVSKVKSRAYIKVVPPNKIVKYNLGNQRAFEESRLPFVLRMISDETLVIRDNAIESARMVLTKNLEERLPGKFYLWIKIYPHHILRNNKAAAGAGADRLSTGMKQSFGIIEGRAARVFAGQELFMIACDAETTVGTARKILSMAKAKLPCSTRIIFEKLQTQ